MKKDDFKGRGHAAGRRSAGHAADDCGIRHSVGNPSGKTCCVSAQTLANEGLRYEAIDGYHASRLDDFTDAIMIGNAVLTTEDLVESAMTARHFAGGETIAR